MQPPQYLPKMGLILLALTIGVGSCNETLDKVFAQTKPASPATVQCTEAQIKTSISRLGEGDTAAFDFLVSCNSQAVPALMKLLKHQDENVRIVAIAILGEIGKGATEAIPLLEEVLKDRREENENIRIVVVDALGKMGKAAVPALIAALEDEDWDVRDHARESLAQIGKPAVPALIIALRDRNAGVRYLAALVLGEIGQEANNALSNLVSVGRNDPCIEPRMAVIESLNQITSNQANSLSSQLVEILKTDRDEDQVQRCLPQDFQTEVSALAEGVSSERETNPPVMCRYPLVRAILRWKCS